MDLWRNYTKLPEGKTKSPEPAAGSGPENKISLKPAQAKRAHTWQRQLEL